MITKSQWITVGIVLWGIPTAILVGLLLSVLTAEFELELALFQWSTFGAKLLFLVPIFIVFGFLLGLLLNTITQKKST